MSKEPIEVLVVDDSAVVRGLLAKALASDEEIVVAGTAMHGEAAIRFLRKKPADVVVLDVEMPVMDGLTALPKILKEFPGTKVVMASTMTYDGAETTVKALRLGAAECIAKPVASNAADSIQQLSQRLVPLVKALGRNRTSSTPRRDYVVCNQQNAPGAPPQIVVIGASTGGPKALSKVIGGLPDDFPLPVLIVQHMPAMFTPMLAKHLERDGGRPCCEAQYGMPIEQGHTYVAPGDFHMGVERRGERMAMTLNQSPPEHFCRPSVNPLYRTAAEWYGGRILAVMLTGMGDDGIEGAADLVARKAHLIAQDEATSVVWGMPGAIVKAGLAHEVLPLDEIAAAVARRCEPVVAR